MERDIPGKTPAIIHSAEIPHYEGAFIPLSQINVLNQPRQKFENIELLALDIARKNILNPLTVAYFDKEKCQEYIDAINKIWDTQHSIDELTPVETEDGEHAYYVLIAGERRLRAFKLLNTIGCIDCQEAHGQGPCYQRHFGNQDIETRVVKNANVWTTIKIQASENTHMSVPPQDEAHFYSMLYESYRNGTNYTISQLARDVGRSPDTIRDALRFCGLPKRIQDFVKEGYISYGVAVELARAKHELGLNDIDFMWWEAEALARQWTVAKFRERVSNEIRNRKNPQEFLGLFTETQEKEFQKSHFKRVVAGEMLSALDSHIRYFEKVNSLFEQNVLGQKDSPFSVRSPLRRFRALIDQQRRLIPHLEGLLSEQKLKDTSLVLETADSLLLSLEGLSDSEPVINYSN